MQEYKFTINSKFILKDVFELKLTCDEPLPSMIAGQFVHIKVPGDEVLLRRPFCLYRWDKKSISLLIQVVGKGTQRLAKLKKGDTVYGIMPIGNGFKLKPSHKKIALVGGGIGVAPLLMIPKSCLGREQDTVKLTENMIVPVKQTIKGTEIRSYLGFTTKAKTILSTGFSSVSEKVIITTDDGTYGIKGYPTDALKADIEAGFIPDVILCCGNHNLTKAVQKICIEHNIEGYMSGEERMGCGVGACLVCTCAVKVGGGQAKHLRACVDGPVFNIAEVVL
ncbi:MAG: dihydroorotate dehydrogenase electron transfer subunit [Firmicutes bacterium]|nr:dihydroorotate dehydrogenase electron transfer subunit [Bacillota bacterium]